MKKISWMYVVSSVIVCTVACKKDVDEPAKGTTATRVKTVEYIYTPGYGDLYNVAYDGSDRILTLDGDTSSIRYQYSTGSFTKEVFTNRVGSAVESVTTFFLNSNQLVDSSYETQYSDTTATKFIYNGANQLSEKGCRAATSVFTSIPGILTPTTQMAT